MPDPFRHCCPVATVGLDRLHQTPEHRTEETEGTGIAGPFRCLARDLVGNLSSTWARQKLFPSGFSRTHVEDRDQLTGCTQTPGHRTEQRHHS